jgi:hypothetical protein
MPKFAYGRGEIAYSVGAIRQFGAGCSQRLYGLDRLNKAQFLACRKRYRPYGTVASFYLWALASEPSTTGEQLLIKRPCYPHGPSGRSRIAV